MYETPSSFYTAQLVRVRVRVRAKAEARARAWATATCLRIPYLRVGDSLGDKPCPFPLHHRRSLGSRVGVRISMVGVVVTPMMG